MIILSRKLGESIVLGSPAVSTVAGMAPLPPISDEAGPSGRGDGSPPASPTLAVTPPPSARDDRRAGPNRRRPRPTPLDCEAGEV